MLRPKMSLPLCDKIHFNVSENVSKNVSENLLYKTPNLIIDNLFLGNLAGASNDQFLEENNITHILNLSCHSLPEKRGITYLHINIKDFIDVALLPVFLVCIPFIKNCLKEKTNILVNCMEGISRSASVVIGYLMNLNYSFDDAYKKVKDIRPIIDPNIGFFNFLSYYNKKMISG